jgi:hypothetical protein
MDIEKIASKLRPLMPERISKLLRARELADNDFKTLIDKQIISLGYRTFGNISDKILLSLPPEEKAKGAINLGTLCYDKEKWPLGISKVELTQNMAILGRSGAGKTNATFHILKQLADRNIPFVFLDWKRTARHLIPSLGNKLNIYTPGRNIAKLPFNPFVVPPGIEANVYASQLVDIMSSAFTLGDGSRSLIRKIILNLYKSGNICPNAADLIDELKKIPDSGRTGGWKITAMRALESIEFANLSSKGQISQNELAGKMLHQSTVIELDSLSQEGKKFLIPILCLWLYYVRLASPEREKLKLVIFIEEAHHVLHKRPQTSGETVLEMLLRQCRELGIGIVIIDQHPHLLSSAALGNTYTTIFLNQKDPSDINKAAAVCLLDGDEKSYFSRLPVGEAIVKLQDRWMSPVHLKMPLVETNKGSVTDTMLARYSAVKASNLTASCRKTFEDTYFSRLPRLPLFDMPLSDDDFRLISDIINNRDDGVEQRYKRLGLSVGSGSRLTEKLVNQGWIESQIVELGQTRKRILRLTKQASKTLNPDTVNPRYGSIVHEYWKRFYGQRFTELGYQVSAEVPRISSGRVDLVAQKDGRKIAIEIETGKSNFINNIKQNLAARYDRIIVVATDKIAFKKIELSMIKEGLLIPGKVDIRVAADSKANLHNIDLDEGH